MKLERANRNNFYIVVCNSVNSVCKNIWCDCHERRQREKGWANVKVLSDSEAEIRVQNWFEEADVTLLLNNVWSKILLRKWLEMYTNVNCGDNSNDKCSVNFFKMITFTSCSTDVVNPTEFYNMSLCNCALCKFSYPFDEYREWAIIVCFYFHAS